MTTVAAGLLVALGAAVGAPLRYLLGAALDGRDPGQLSWGILLANVAGSLLLGLFSAMALSGSLTALLGTGFCGAFTTYSSFAVGVVEAGPRRGSAYVVLTLGLALPACALGFWLGAA